MRLNYILGIGIVLALVSASLLVAFGFLYVKPYINVRTYKETVCTTVSQDHSMRQLVTCQCAADGSSTCVSQYPCIKVWVNYTRVDSVFVENATLYDSYETFHIQQSALQCSYHKCSRIHGDNVQAVNNFAAKYQLTSAPFTCYYDPSDQTFAVLDIVLLSTTANAIIWPAVALVVGLIIFFVQVFHIDPKRAKQKRNQFSSLERQWARIKERNYGRMESAGSERLVQSEQLGAASHNAVCLAH